MKQNPDLREIGIINLSSQRNRNICGPSLLGIKNCYNFRELNFQYYKYEYILYQSSFPSSRANTKTIHFIFSISFYSEELIKAIKI